MINKIQFLGQIYSALEKDLLLDIYAQVLYDVCAFFITRGELL